ncbi:MAG: hypothetical protein ACTXOO_03520 [Sodalis sp. (in: enterobacteria)]
MCKAALPKAGYYLRVVQSPNDVVWMHLPAALTRIGIKVKED